MILGRILGTFIAVSLMALFPTRDMPTLILFIFIFTAIGVAVGMLGSLYFGPSIDNNRPLPQDSLEYWTTKYGQEEGELAYKYWLGSQ